MVKRGTREVSASLARIRPVVEVIQKTAQQLQPYEKLLRRKIEDLEAIVDDNRITLFDTPLEGEERLIDLLTAGEGDTEDVRPNSFGLFYQINKALLATYQKIYSGSDEEDSSVTPLWQRLTLIGPTVLSGLDFSNQLARARTEEKLSVKDECELAAKEMDRTYAVANDYASSIRLLFNLSGELETLGDTFDTLAVKFFGHMKEAHLLHGHKIISSPSLTSVADFIYNYDPPGIADVDQGVKPKNLSKYQLERSTQLLSYLTSPEVYPFVRDGNRSVSYAIDELKILHAFFAAVFPFVRSFQKEYAKYTEESTSYAVELFSIQNSVKKMKTIDFADIHRQRAKGVSSQLEADEEERENAALTEIVDGLESLGKIESAATRTKRARKIVSRIYELRAASVRAEEQGKRYYRTLNKGEDGRENQIDIELVDPPNGDISKVRGKNFDKVKAWLHNLRDVAQYEALATSLDPRRRVRENVFIIGPPGCGKTESMRAVHSYYDWIVVNLAGPDLGTMWRDETQKNPGRLYDRLDKLHHETGKRIIVCLDEAEGIFEKGQGRDSKSSKQLTAAFNELLDGVRYSKGISLIAAANNVENIPESLMRRFSPDIYVVGELTAEDRSALLEDFVGRCLPVDKSVTPETYIRLARRMHDATGDIVRTPVEKVSKYFLREMVGHHPEEAERLNQYLCDDTGTFHLRDLTSERMAYVKEGFAKQGYVLTSKLLSDAVQSTMANGEIRDRVRKAREVYREANRKVKEIQGLGL